MCVLNTLVKSLKTELSASERLFKRLQDYKKYQQNKGNLDVAWVDKVVYSSYIQSHLPKRSFRYRLRENARKDSVTAVERLGKSLMSPPISAKYLNYDTGPNACEETESQSMEDGDSQNMTFYGEEEMTSSTPVFPYQSVTKMEYLEEVQKDDDDEPGGVLQGQGNKMKYVSEADRLIKAGVDLEQILSGRLEKAKNIEEDGDESVEDKMEMVKNESGSPDANIPSSSVPCGGCGALLHCQDSAIPGYMPSERFKMLKGHLRRELCLRCHCLKTYNTALNVNIGPDDYPKVLKELEKHFAMVILLVDLTDFPCSIWPGIIDIIGSKRPVFLVGNKVDLIPRDSKKYLERIEDVLRRSAREVGLGSAKIIHTAVISATTGYGIEDLISKIHELWGSKGDIFIMGCTNVGKSSLFNALIQSDLCKPDVVDLVQTATISNWPGTTLNLLKFPIMRPDPWKSVIRHARLSKEAVDRMPEDVKTEKMFRETKDPKLGILTGTVGRTFLSKHTFKEISKPKPARDPFRHDKYPPRYIPQTGEWNPNEPSIQGKWCFDTPGVVNPNQLLDILTLPELMKTLPKNLIEPRSYYIKEGLSLFVGGLARIDYVDGGEPIRYTVYCSDHIPITIVETVDADYFYEKAVGTHVLGVPEGGGDRLSKFPSLSATDFTLIGENTGYSCADIVLSPAGWVAVTVRREHSIQVRVHTPGGKGIFLRPSILPYAITRKGPRIRGSLAYLPHKVYIPNKNNKI